MNNVISLKELNEIYQMDIAEFVHKKFEEDWILQSELYTQNGKISLYKDKNGIVYTIEYTQNEIGTFLPYRLLRICHVNVDLT